MFEIIYAMAQLTLIGLGIAVFIALVTAPRRTLKYAWRILEAIVEEGKKEEVKEE